MFYIQNNIRRSYTVFFPDKNLFFSREILVSIDICLGLPDQR